MRADLIDVNLDCLDRDELWAIWTRYQGGRNRKDAAALVGDRRAGYTVIAANVANYACNKAVAMDCRKRGDIPAALVYEQICDGIYQAIPADLRW